MKNRLLSLVLLAALVIPVSASEYISTYDFAVVDDKAYLVEIVDGQTILKQYSFPGLVVANQLVLGNDFSYAYASTSGVIVSTYTYDIPTETLVAEEDSQTKVYKETRTIQTYDLALAPIATKTSEYEYYYTFFSSGDSNGATASGKATPVENTKCSDGKKHKGKKKSCNKVLL
jgi:hypothetical protein